ncbi:Bax inhibitor-1/YccA family membrane protein [Streptomyces sp. TR06-5]|uniref:Bax inhibitor-1/YccA family protein n=1 Tax=unclassified Streptomyces TaxID=2593676 RepID=UPI0039A0CAC8
MRSSNPVFSRRGIGRDSGHAGFGAGQHQQAGNPYAAGPATNPYATNPYAQTQTAPGQAPKQGAPPVASQTGRMTIDDVVTRTGMTLGTVILTAAAAWITGVTLGIAIGAALVAMVLAFVQIFKRKPSPALILGYAAFEGVFLGSISNYLNTYVGNGVAMQAVLGTMAVFAAVLFMYKQRIIRVTRRFYQFTMAAALGFVLLMGVNLLFALFAGGDGLGFRTGGLGILFGIIGIVLGAAFLAMDFKQVEDGIAYGAPREESWLAAFGLTLTLVWIYLEFLRLLSILNSD